MVQRLPIPIPPLLRLVDPARGLDKIIAYYISRLQGMHSSDYSRSHKQAEDLLCEFLWEVGYGEVAEAYKSARSQIGFTY